MAILETASKVHWNYFLALERDLEIASRYVEFCAENMRTFSIEFAHLLLAAASEVDVVAKLLCAKLDPPKRAGNIGDYKSVLNHHLPDLTLMQVHVPRYGLTMTPWENWAGATNPDWWRSYNNVKHQRDAHFQEATLQHALNAMAGLKCLIFHHYRLAIQTVGREATSKETTRVLQPEASLLRFDADSYYSHLIVG